MFFAVLTLLTGREKKVPIKMENEKLIRDFLFGELTERERFEFEERFITDANLFAQIKVVEDELIEKYVRGWMDSAECSKFEKHFLNTEKRRERVGFSHRFINSIQNNRPEIAVAKKTDEIVSDESVWQKIAGFFVVPKIAMATAFAVLIAVFGSWFVYQTLNTNKTEIAKNQNSIILPTPQQIITPTPEAPIIETPENSENNQKDDVEKENSIENPVVEKPLETPKKPVKEIKKTPTPTKTPQVKMSAPNPVLALFAGTMRSEGKNNVLKLPANSTGAMLLLNLESVDYKVYQAEITDENGNVIFRKENLKAKKSKINLFIPTRNLKKSDYIIKLYGENESVADFQFRVK